MLFYTMTAVLVTKYPVKSCSLKHGKFHCSAQSENFSPKINTTSLTLSQLYFYPDWILLIPDNIIILWHTK